jgi:RNA polymerase sigma factor (sigma-70 family)
MADSSLTPVLEHLRRLAGLPATAISDRWLLQQFLAGDEAAFADLVQRHGAMVLSVGRRVLRSTHDAEDVFQATFLVLARKAAAVQKRESVGSFLHGVAYRLALKMRADLARQHRRVEGKRPLASPEPLSEAAWHELQALLDAELRRLPEKYRAPLLLFYWEGKTHEEIARQLDWPLGTVKSRLAAARDLLRRRLTRRGLTLSAATTTTALAVATSSQAVLAGLLAATWQAAVRFAKGQHTADTVGTAVFRLAEAGLHAGSAAKWIFATVLFAVGLAAAGGGVWAYHLQQANPEGQETLATASEGAPVDPRAEPPPRTDVAAQALSGSPFLKALWSQPTIHEKKTQELVSQAVEANEAGQLPTISAFVPIAVTIQQGARPIVLVVYRSFWGIHAVRLQGGKVQWDGSSEWSCDAMVKNRLKAFWLEDCIRRCYQQKSRLALLFENSLLGRLSADGMMIYAVEDLGLPPLPEAIQELKSYWKEDSGPVRATQGNHLQAFSLATDGKQVWDLGGLSPTEPDLKGTYFLGPPLPVDGKLYVLNEKDSDLRLLCVEPPQLRAQPVKIASIVKLGSARTGLLKDPGRRVRAVLLAYADGILVCPTNAGFIVGVDPHTGRQVWKHTYQAPEKQTGPASLTGTWKVAPPVIHDGKVVFTDPDSEFIYCLNLRDGKQLWQAERKNDLYLAGVHGDRVILVGPSTCRALRLADGHLLWQVETGLPSGYGMIRGHILYLPLKDAATTQRPEVCALDLDTGRIVAHNHARAQADGSMEIPGNLLDVDGTVISQTVTAITAYPQQAEILARIDAVLKKNPKDPTALMERGDLRFFNGDLTDAVEDFRAALANQPPPAILRRLKLQLFDALTELGKRDPKALEKYLDEYEKLGKEVLRPRVP